MSLANFSPATEHTLRQRGIDLITPLTPEHFPDICARVSEACDALNLPMPDIYTANHDGPKVITVEDKAVILSSSLLETLEAREIAGVVAHELANREMNFQRPIRNFLPWVSGLAAIGAVEYAAPLPGVWKHLSAVALGATVAGGLNLLNDTAQRYEADREAARVVGHEAMIGALQKIGNWHRQHDASEQTPLAFRAVEAIYQLFDPYPPLDSRVARLERERKAGTNASSVLSRG
jgi:heat shock protein HtpX